MSRILYGLTHRVRCTTGEDLNKVSADNYGSFIGLPGGTVIIPLGFVGNLWDLFNKLLSGKLLRSAFDKCHVIFYSI